MKYLAIFFACVSIVSCSSTVKEDTGTKAGSDTSGPEALYDDLSFLEQLQLFHYAQSYRNKCVRPSESFYLTLGVLEMISSGKGAQPSSEYIPGLVSSVVDKAQAAKGNSQIERPDFEFVSPPTVLANFERASEQCIESTFNYLNDLSGKYTSLAEGKEFPSDTSAFSAYIEAKSTLLLRSYSIETNEYRLHPNTDVFTLDGYTEFMFRVYQFMVTSNALMVVQELKQEQQERLIHSFQQVQESRKKIDKDFGVFNGLQLALKLAKEKEGQQFDFSADFKKQKETINSSVDIFYPVIEEIKAQFDSSGVDLKKVVQLMTSLDSLLALHERRVSIVRVEVKKTLDAMITQAK